MADLCLPLLTFTALALYQSPPICQLPTDGQHSICQTLSCPPVSQQFDCVRADGAHYIWQPAELPASPAEARAP